MPNWVHNTLEVRGEADDLARFVEAVCEDVSEERLREQFSDAARFGTSEETFEEYRERRISRRAPLSFDRVAPFDPAEWPTTYRTCFVCGGTGERPGALEEFGADWIVWCGGCNGCKGTGRSVDREGWYRHHLEEWGTKWDASFGGPFIALGADEADVDATVGAQGLVSTPTVAVYKFDTPWSPPEAFVERASALYPDLELTLQWGDAGGGEAGRFRFVGGVALERDELEVEDVLMPEEMWF